LPSEQTIERRRAPRRAPAVDEPLRRVRLRAGRELLVIDVSDAGILTEGVMRLLPGTHVDVHLVTRDGRQLIRSRVVRAFVHYLESDLIRYRGALAFDRRIDTAGFGYAVPGVLASNAAVRGNAYPEHGRESVVTPSSVVSA
jgi:hypothetical protein